MLLNGTLEEAIRLLTHDKQSEFLLPVETEAQLQPTCQRIIYLLCRGKTMHAYFRNEDV